MSALYCFILTFQAPFSQVPRRFFTTVKHFIVICFPPRRALGLIKKFEMNQLNYRLSHPVAALQTSLTKDMDKYSRIRFDYASFDAQVFGKQPLMGTNQDPEMMHYPDCKFHTFFEKNKQKNTCK